MKYLFLLLLTACGSAENFQSNSIDDTPQSETITLEIKSGSGFSCFAYLSDIYCKGRNSTVGIDSTNFEIYFSDIRVDDLELLNNTICIQSNSTYCIGSATLNGSYASFPIQYPYQGQLNNFTIQPFMESSLPIDYLMNQTTIFSDLNQTTVIEAQCNKSETMINCGSFSIQL